MVRSQRCIPWLGLFLTAMCAAAAPAQTPTIAAPYRSRIFVEPATMLSAHPTQMAWGPDHRLYVMTADGGVLSYSYKDATGTLSDAKAAVPNVQGVGIAFYRKSMYLSTLAGAIVKLNDKNGNGVWGETGELNVPIVTGIPTGDHPVDQIQIQGRSLFVGIGRRTINGRKGLLTSGSQDDFGGVGFWVGGNGNTWGDCAYGGTISWIQDLDAVPDTPGAANVYTPSTVITQSLLQQDDRPYTTRNPGKLVVYSAGTRNPFGLCFDLFGRLWFTNNFNRTATMGNGQSGFGYLRDTPGPDFSRDVQDQLFQASPGADYGYADDNWRGKNPMLTPKTRGYHRVLSTTFDNLFNTGPYALHDPAHPDGLGPSSSADGCDFWYSWQLPLDLWGDIFIARWNNAITEAPNGGVQHTLSYSDVVAVDTWSGHVRQVALGFGNPIAILWDGDRRLLVADYSSPLNGGNGAVFALRADLPNVKH